MTPTLITLIIGAIGLAAWMLLDDPPPRPLNLPREPFPDNWRELLQKRWPLYNALPEVLQHQLEQLTLVFLDRIEFQGVDLEITDEMRVVTAAQACLLLLNQDTFYSPQLRSVVIHPSAYTATSHDQAGGEMMEKQIAVQGQSWGSGSVVLSWDNTRTGAANAKDGRNLVLHEFAHQLDQADGKADGAPALGSREQYQRWQKVCTRVFTDLREKVDRGSKTVIDDYGATNPAEFFAVATETFFEKPHQLNKRRPELYALLSEYYRVNPLSWP